MQQASPNPLAQWLQSRDKQAFARALEISPAHLSLVCNNRRGLSPKKAKRVEDLTGGAVTMAQLAQIEVSR
jgi:DNA-binding transcriptional regulator YdaS (Cro superfamily)